MAQELTSRTTGTAKASVASSAPASILTAEELEARRTLVRQVLGSRCFAKSARLSQFFAFVCGRALDGRTEEINEQQIGVHVFGRSPEYSANDDSIVRSQARLLRQRLEEYFENECPYCATVILIPKGGYVPVFEARPLKEAESTSGDSTGPALPEAKRAVGEGTRAELQRGVSESSAPGVAREARRFRAAWLAFGVVVLLALAAGLLWTLRPMGWMQGGGGSSASSLLWRGIFGAGRLVVIVPSDDGLVLSQEMRKSAVTLDDYLSGDYLRHGPSTGTTVGPGDGVTVTSEWLSSHQYTSTADLELAVRLSRLPEAAKADVEPRYARVVRLDDLKSSNVILIGGIGANPWVALYAPRLTFDVNYDWKAHEGYVRNRDPHVGEQARYLETHADGSVSSYGVLAYLPGMGGNGSALLFEGSGMAGTEAAAAFPFESREFADFARKLGHTATGGLPYFEVLLETRSLGGNDSGAHVVAWRVVQP
jgi:hypothetical protein